MIGDFRKLKNLSIAHNPFACECQWRGPLLLLDQRGIQLQEQFELLAKRQHELVTEAFSRPELAPPKSVIDWLNTTNIHFLQDRHPLRSKGSYFCQGEENKVALKDFFEFTCKQARSLHVNVSFALLSGLAAVVLLLLIGLLIATFVYESAFKKLFTSLEENSIQNFKYDAFVSYSAADSDWVLQKLVPNLEGNNQDIQDENRIKLCVYDRDFIAGHAITECIIEAIKNSRKVILIVTENFIQRYAYVLCQSCYNYNSILLQLLVSF